MIERNRKVIRGLVLAMTLVSVMLVATGCSSASTTSAASEDAMPDGSYTTVAQTNHFASSCLAGIDYDSVFDVRFDVKGGAISAITLDIGPNAKNVPETADVSMEDWPFTKLAEVSAISNLIGTEATEDAIMEAWALERAEELAEQGIDATSGATEAGRAIREAIINTIAMDHDGYSYDNEVLAKDVVPQLTMFEGEIIAETVGEDGRVSKTVKINDGNYTLFGLVSAKNNGIDETVVDYDYIILTRVTVEDGTITAISSTTPNGSEASAAALAEADEISQKLVGVEATNTAIMEKIPYNSRSEEAFEGSVGAMIACDMISNALRNGCTHIVGWSY